MRPSAYKLTEIERYQSVNDPSKPLSALNPLDQESELLKICEKLWKRQTQSSQGEIKERQLRGI